MKIYKCKLVKEREVEYEAEISCARDAEKLFRKLGLNKEPEEVFWIACLNTKGKVIGMHEVSRGSLAICPVHPRDIFKRALLNNASSIILCHKHPSGDPDPSSEDKELTRRLIQAGKILGVKIVDHIVVGDYYFSFAGNGYMEE